MIKFQRFMLKRLDPVAFKKKLFNRVKESMKSDTKSAVDSVKNMKAKIEERAAHYEKVLMDAKDKIEAMARSSRAYPTRPPCVDESYPSRAGDTYRGHDRGTRGVSYCVPSPKQ